MRLGRLRQEAIARTLARVPRSALRLLPGSSRGFGPPRRSATIHEYLRQHDGEWMPILPAQRSDYPAPKSLLHHLKKLRTALAPVEWPEAGVAVIPGGRVLDENAWAVGANDTFLYEFSFLGERPNCPIFLLSRLSPPIRLTGTTLNLGSCWAPINYGHFVFDALPRLELFLRAGFTLDQVDHIILPRFNGPSAAQLVERLGLPATKILRPQRGSQYECERLIQPSYPGSSAYYRPLVGEFYRRPAFAPRTTSKFGRRLYIPRRGPRKLSNSAELENLLHARSFETVDFRTMSDECAYFGEASVLVGPHGAGLSSLVFCRPGTRMLELLPSNHLFPFFYSAACACGLDYWALPGVAEHGPINYDPLAPPSDADFSVDPSELAAVLDAMDVR